MIYKNYLTGLLMLILLMPTVFAFNVDVGTMFEDSVANYTVNKTFYADNITVETLFYINSTEFCDLDYRDFINTSRDCSVVIPVKSSGALIKHPVLNQTVTEKVSAAVSDNKNALFVVILWIVAIWFFTRKKKK